MMASEPRKLRRMHRRESSVVTEKVVEGKMECKNESGQLSEHDNCRCPQRPSEPGSLAATRIPNPILVSALKPLRLLKLHYILVASVECESTELHGVGS